MTRKTIVRASGLIALVGAMIALPAEARTTLVENASMASGYLEEIAIGIAIIAGAVILDTTSWSIMTDGDR